MENVLCTEIQVFLALCLLNSEKDVTLMAFTDDKNKLKPIKWTSATTFDEAMQGLTAEAVSK